jgi:hypothetical protein
MLDKFSQGEMLDPLILVIAVVNAKSSAKPD